MRPEPFEPSFLVRSFVLAGLVGLVLALPTPVPAAAGEPTPTPQRMLGLIRAQFRTHRPPPPLESYTITRAQKATNGYPDFVNSYTFHVWVRNLDKAALTRQVFRDDARGPLSFDRPAFNEARDPGPPTADIFEPAPARPHPVSEVPTPEPNYTPLPVIGGVRTIIESDYRVDSLEVEGDQLHLHIFPIGVVGGNYTGDGQTVDFTFTDIAFPRTLPDWYFDARQYAQHANDSGPL